MLINVNYTRIPLLLYCVTDGHLIKVDIVATTSKGGTREGAINVAALHKVGGRWAAINQIHGPIKQIKQLRVLRIPNRPLSFYLYCLCFIK